MASPTIIQAYHPPSSREVPTESEERRDFEDIHGHRPEASEDDLAAWVKEKYDRQQWEMQARMHHWAFNIRFVDGEQWLVPSEIGLQWHEPPVPEDEIRVTNNVTRGAVEYRIAKLTESRPIPKVFPHSNEVADRDRAEAAQQLSSHLYRVLDLSERYDEALWYDAVCGSGYVYVGYETDRGKHVAARIMKIMVGENGIHEESVFVDADMNPVQSEGEAYMYRPGEVSVQVIPPWGVFVADPEETDMRRQPWMLLATIESLSDLKRRFGTAASNISGGSGGLGPLIYYQDLISGLSRGRPYGDRRRRRLHALKDVENRVLVLRYFERPTDAFPDGRHLIVAGNDAIHMSSLPYGADTFPVVQLRTRHRTRDFYGKPFAEDLVGPQKRINQLESHAVQYISLYASGGLTSQHGALVEESWLEGFGRILYHEGDRPQPLNWPNMPSDVWDALGRAYDAFDRIAGYQDVARGGVPPGVKAARAILELKRSNDTPLGKALQRFDRFIEELTHQLILRARWGYTEPHVIEVMGHDAPHLTRALTRDDLPTEFGVRIETDSLLRLSYPAKLEMLLEFHDRGLMQEPQVKRMLNFGDWEHESGQWNRDYARARDKIDRLEMGQPVNVYWWEDDLVHMLAIEERLKDPRFEDAPEEFRMALNQLWLAHFQQFQMKQAGQMPPELAAGGMGGPGGDPEALDQPPSPPTPPEPVPGAPPTVEDLSQRMDMTPGHDAYRPMGDMRPTVAGQGFGR